MLPRSIYAYIWQIARAGQIRICVLTAIVVPLAMVPLELQRRIVDDALHDRSLSLLFLLGAGYLAVVVFQNGIKYILNITKGRVHEQIARDLRYRILARVQSGPQGKPEPPEAAPDQGTTISMLAAESDDVGGFASESLSTPLLQAGTIVSVVGYLIWVQPYIAIFAVVLYLPQAVVVPRVQHAINRLNRARTWMVRKLGRNAVEVSHLSEAQEIERRKRASVLVESVFATRMKIYYRKYFLTAFGNLSDAFGPIAVLMVGGWLVIRGETEISTIVVFISGLHRIQDPWDQLINFYRTASNARIAYSLIAEALHPQMEEADLLPIRL